MPSPLFLSIVATGAGLVPFIAVYWIAVQMLSKGALEPDMLWWPLWVSAVAIILKALLAAASSHLSHVAAYNILHDLRVALAAKLERVPLGYFSSHSSGSLKKIIADDVEQIEEAVAHAIPDIAAGVAVPLLSAAVLCFIDWRLALAAIAMFPVLISIYPLTLRATKPHSIAYFGALARLRSVTVQYVQGMKVIRAFLAADAAYTDFHKAVDDMADIGERFSTASLVPMSVLYTGLRANVLVLIPAGSLLYLSGEIGASEFILFLLIGMGMNAPILKLLFTGGSFYWRIKGAGAQIHELLEAPELAEPRMPIRPQGHTVRFRNVTFGYDEKPVIEAVDFEAGENSMTALVGPSGSGKTTLVKLAARFWDVQQGSIEIGGVDVRLMSRNDLASMISFVLQEPWLMNDTIRANILSGRPEATMEEVEDAARRARVEEFAASLPQGLDSPVGEGGRQLSGGQRQRVAIARAILRATPMVLLDEATAALDPDNEALVLEALSELARGCTVIAIAHRLDTIRNADQIVYLEAGKVKATGSHDKLKQNCAPYTQLWRSYEDVADWHLDRQTAQEASIPEVIENAPAAHVDEPELPAGIVALFLHLAGPMRSLLLKRGIPLLFLEGLFFGAPVFATYFTLDAILKNQLTLPASLLYTGVTGLCFFIHALLNICSHRVLWKVQVKAVASLQHRLGRHLRRVPLGSLQARDTGVLETLITQHATELNFVTPPSQAMRVLIGPILGFLVLIWIDWRLALVAVATLPFFAAIVLWSERIFKSVWKNLVSSQEQFNSRILDFVQGMPTLRLLGLGEKGFVSLSQALDHHRRVSRETVTRLTPTVAVGWIVLDLGFCALLFAGGLMAATGEMEPSTYLLFLVIGLVFYGPIADAFDLAAYRRLVERTMARVRDVLGLPLLSEPESPSVPRSLDIRFENVNFSYGEVPVLRGIDLELKAGLIHALTGPSGTGKSTILALLARFWDPDEGRITVGGVDLRQISSAMRSRLFAPVFQDTYLFDDTIAANIRIGKPEATYDQIVLAAQTAHCHDFIMSLENGYETGVGEGGITPFRWRAPTGGDCTGHPQGCADPSTG
ncbi:ABC transporter ATP-binding protein [Ochrobactrum pecoris]|nr:ABC transporter ATP-binding protein [Brucella pecoris]